MKRVGVCGDDGSQRETADVQGTRPQNDVQNVSKERKVMKQILTRTNPGLNPPGPSGHNVLAPRV